MKVFVLTKENLLRMGKYVGLYLVSLSVAAFVGLLPLLALVAGLPTVLAARRLGRSAAQLVSLISLAVTWLLLDGISFVYVGLGLMMGYSLAMLLPHVPFRLGFAQSVVVGFIWALVMNLVLKLVEGEGLLPLLSSQLQQALSMTAEAMRSMEFYTAAQVSDFEQYGQLMVQTLHDLWAYILFVYILISTAATYALSRLFGVDEQPTEDVLASRFPLPLAIATVVLAGLHYLLPTVATAVVNNLWSIAALLMSLSGILLVLFYLRFLRVSLIWRLFLGFYLLTNPVVWRVLLLVGLFDTLFDYRYYARKRQQE